MKTILETPRLRIREHTPDDRDDFLVLNSDPEVMKYTGDALLHSPEEAETIIRYIINQQYRQFGYGRWAVILKSSGQYLGWCGLKHQDFDEGIDYPFSDIGFRFARKYWNQGYATEAAAACLHLGFHTLNIPLISGRALTQNLASIRVLQKIGLQYVKTYSWEGEETVLYEKQNPALL